MDFQDPVWASCLTGSFTPDGDTVMSRTTRRFDPIVVWCLSLMLLTSLTAWWSVQDVQGQTLPQSSSYSDRLAYWNATVNANPGMQFNRMPAGTPFQRPDRTWDTLRPGQSLGLWGQIMNGPAPLAAQTVPQDTTSSMTPTLAQIGTLIDAKLAEVNTSPWWYPLAFIALIAAIAALALALFGLPDAMARSRARQSGMTPPIPALPSGRRMEGMPWVVFVETQPRYPQINAGPGATVIVGSHGCHVTVPQITSAASQLESPKDEKGGERRSGEPASDQQFDRRQQRGSADDRKPVEAPVADPSTTLEVDAPNANGTTATTQTEAPKA